MANERELEEFLLRAAERRVAQGKKRQPPRMPEPPRATQPPVRADVIEDAQLVHEGVAEHVERHLDSSAFDQRAERLGDDVEVADDQMEARIHEKFDHDLGEIDAQVASRGQKAFIVPPALGFIKNKDQLIQAIIVSEILGNPADRW